MRVIYVVVGFRAGYPEVSPATRASGLSARAGASSRARRGVAFISRWHGDVVVTKHRVSAFAGTDLDMILRAGGVDTLVLAGIATSGGVLSTVHSF
jgi:nicotinamidase-related amidase